MHNIMTKILSAIVLLLFCACEVIADVNFTPLPPPPATAKLRIFVVAVTSSEPKMIPWKVSKKEFVARMVRRTDKILNDRGIYEVVKRADVETVLGDQKFFGEQWLKDELNLARQVGKALHADYVLCIERGAVPALFFNMQIYNLQTGKIFIASQELSDNGQMRAPMGNAYEEMVNLCYQELFNKAKQDLIKTAMAKGKIYTKTEQPPAAEIKKGGVGDQPPPVAAKPAAPVKTTVLPPAKEIKPAAAPPKTAAITAKDIKRDDTRLIVYDFDANAQMRIVGLILADALREELHKIGGFVLVNRENMTEAMSELDLQRSGLVNEKQAVKLGQWLAAGEAITGNFGVLGSSSVLQVKRIDIKTMGTISLGSIKCKAGSEDELLDNMPQLARKLTELNKK